MRGVKKSFEGLEGQEYFLLMVRLRLGCLAGARDVFTLTADPDSIIEKINRGKQALE